MHFQKAHDHSQMCLDNIKDVVVKTAWEEPLLSVFVSLSDALDTNFLAVSVYLSVYIMLCEMCLIYSIVYICVRMLLFVPRHQILNTK